jgi:hypothetical protein
VIFLWFWDWYCRCEIVGLNRDSSRFPDPGFFPQPFLAVDHEKMTKSGSTWYSTDSSWADQPNGRKISGWLHQFTGKLAVHPGVGATQLTINTSLRNPPSSCAARHPPAFEQLEYCRPWNILEPPIDPILFGQLRLSAVERPHNNGSWTRASWWKLPRRPDELKVITVPKWVRVSRCQ